MSEQQLRILNEQWVRDGIMYKAIKKGERCVIACSFLDEQVPDGLTFIELAPVNEDGCLPSSWGDYPTISVPSYEKEPWCVYAYLRRKEVVIKQEKAWGDTEQEAVDNWNKR